MPKINTKIRPRGGIFQPFKEIREITDEVIVPVSLGYDSAVVLDFSCRIFKKVHAYFGYLVKGLEFQEKILRYHEKRYGIEILRLPSYELAEAIARGLYRVERTYTTTCTMDNTIALARKRFGFPPNEGWVLIGFKASDGPHRYMAINQYGYIRHQHKKAYPLAYFKKKDVHDYVEKHKVPVHDTRFETVRPKSFYEMKMNHPEEWHKVLKEFPFADAGVIRYKQILKNKKEREEAKKKLKKAEETA